MRSSNLRYLTGTGPPHPEGQKKLTLASGNGLDSLDIMAKNRLTCFCHQMLIFIRCGARNSPSQMPPPEEIPHEADHLHRCPGSQSQRPSLVSTEKHKGHKQLVEVAHTQNTHTHTRTHAQSTHPHTQTTRHTHTPTTHHTRTHAHTHTHTHIWNGDFRRMI